MEYKPTFLFKTLQFLLIFSFLLAKTKTGSLTGIITDAENKEPLIGANVILMTDEYSLGTAAGMDGSFFISGVPTGKYSIQITYIGYDSKIIDNIIVKTNRTTSVDVALSISAIQLSSVNVIAKVDKSEDIDLLDEKKNAVGLQDGISADRISKSGDSNAAEAVRRLSGVNIIERKFAIIRGLGDRYNTTQLNNAPIPSPEPDRKAVPLDLFPTALLERIVVHKTFSPDLPGVFAGGSINIITKAYPDKRIVKVKLLASDKSYFEQSRLFLLGHQSKSDYWGFDDGSRELPITIPDTLMLGKYDYFKLGLSRNDWYKTLGNYGKSFSSGFSYGKIGKQRPISLGLEYGDKYNPLHWLEYGYFFNINFANNLKFKQFSNNQYGISDGELIDYVNIDNNQTAYTTNVSASMSSGFMINNQHKIKFQIIYTHTSEDKLTRGYGFTPNIEEGLFIKQYYVEKSIRNFSLSGTHTLPYWENHKLEWNINSGLSTRFEPDTRSQNYQIKNDYYELVASSSKAGLRDFTDGIDKNKSIDLNHSFTLGKTKFKSGVRLQSKYRQFEKRSFYYEHSKGFWPSEMLRIEDESQFGDLFSINNMYSIDPDGNVTDGLLLIESTDGANRNGYQAIENNNAGYLMVDISLYTSDLVIRSIRLITGARYEKYNLSLNPYNPVTKTPYTSTIMNGDTISANTNETQLLPLINFIVDLSNNVKIRTAFSQTIARGEFREIAPFAYQEFYGGDIMVGYPRLETTHISNSDLLLEWYPSAIELISFGMFYKDIKSPIEVALISTPDLVYKTFQNAKSAKTSGLEIEIKKRLSFIPLNIGHGLISMNSTFSSSKVWMDTTVTLFNGTQYKNSASDINRPMVGQSNFLFNANLDLNFTGDYAFTLAYNTFSPRLSTIGVGELGNEYEFTFHSLNMTLSKKLGPINVSIKAKNLLNDQITFGLIEQSSGKVKNTKSYHPGQSVSLGISFKL